MEHQNLNYAEILQFLKKQTNPFSNDVVKDVWEEMLDVPEINKQVSDKVYETIQYVQDNNANQELLLLGEPGSGKTHLLARIQRKAESSHKFLFVYVKPIGDITKINQQILRELMTLLLKKMPERKLSPLLQFTTVIIRQNLSKGQQQGNFPEGLQASVETLIQNNSIDEFWQSLEDLEINTKEKLFELIIRTITEENPEIDATFLRGLLCLLNRDLQSWTQSWLKGTDLPEDDLKHLGVYSIFNYRRISRECTSVNVYFSARANSALY